MATIDLDRMAKEVHAEAVQKGFWDRADAEAIAISGLHCELSEAYQQDRLGRRMLYHSCRTGERDGYCSVDCPLYEDACPHYDEAPEGVAVELADFVLRLLDWVGYKGVKLGNYDKLTLRNYMDVSLPELTAQLHNLVSELRTMFGGQGMRHVTQARIVRAIRSVDGWLLSRQMELWSVIVIKRDYNRTRPLLNGKRY